MFLHGTADTGYMPNVILVAPGDQRQLVKSTIDAFFQDSVARHATLFIGVVADGSSAKKTIKKINMFMNVSCDDIRVAVIDSLESYNDESQNTFRKMVDTFKHRRRFVFVTTNINACISPLISRCLVVYPSPARPPARPQSTFAYDWRLVQSMAPRDIGRTVDRWLSENEVDLEALIESLAAFVARLDAATRDQKLEALEKINTHVMHISCHGDKYMNIVACLLTLKRLMDGHGLCDRRASFFHKKHSA